MYNASNHGFCQEFYTVEKTIEVVVMLKGQKEPTTIRIDAVRDEKTGKYCSHAYTEESLTVQPTYPQTGSSFIRKPENFTIWVDYDLPWTDRDSADGALDQALDFLRQRVSGKP